MKPTALLAVVSALLAQTVNPSPRELLSVARKLTTIEIGTILSASRKELIGKTFRVPSTPGGQELEVLLGSTGAPKMARTSYRTLGGTIGGVVSGRSTSSIETRWSEDIIKIIDYTDRPARRCDGSAEKGEMVIEYMFRSSTKAWTVTARRRDPHDVGGLGIAPAFEMLRGAGLITNGERRRIGGHWARAFITPWAPPADRSPQPLLTGDPIPNVAGHPVPNDPTQSLWIDAESLLPLRWEASDRKLSYGFDFIYESIDLRRPSGIEAPECIQ